MGHGAANPLVAAVLLDVSDPLLTLRHDLCSLQVEVFMDHLQTHNNTIYSKENKLCYETVTGSAVYVYRNIKNI